MTNSKTPYLFGAAVFIVFLNYFSFTSNETASNGLGAIDNSGKRMNWDTKYAVKRAIESPSSRDLAITPTNGGRKHKKQIGAPEKSVAVLLQLGNTDMWQDLLKCTANIATAASMKNYLADVYIAFHDTEKAAFKREHKPKQAQLESFHGVGKVYFDYTENKGADVFMFMNQLDRLNKSHASKYDYIVKQHSKSDNMWRLRHIESLCGTPEQVIAIWNQFDTDGTLGFVAPQGTTMQPQTSPDTIFPVISQRYFQGKPDVSGAFDDHTMSQMGQIHDHIRDDGDNTWDRSSALIIAGTCFWTRPQALRPENLVKIETIKNLDNQWSDGYKENGGLEHIVERLIVSYGVNDGWQVAEAIPAPRPFAMYFPQYHQFEENDRFWGEGFTEWTLLKPNELPGLRKPLAIEEGGLGYYDLMDTKVRERQADLARRSGVSGFVFYHYWFSGEHSPDHHKVMYKTIEQMLVDGEPDMPFMLSWANEPWTKRWTGVEEAGSTLLGQGYGDEEDWTEHFYYLYNNFFTHPNYVWIDNKPVFILYRIGHMEKFLDSILQVWDRLANDNGMDGIHIIHTFGNFYRSDANTKTLETNPLIEGAFHFWPQCVASGCSNGQMDTPNVIASFHDSGLNVKKEYWGAMTGFDRRVRDSTAVPMIADENNFNQALQKSFHQMSTYSNRDIDYNLYFLTAWNEWNEQALLEPDDVHKFNYLEILRNNLESCPLRKNVFLRENN